MNEEKNRSLLEAFMKTVLDELLTDCPAEFSEEDSKRYHPAEDLDFLERLDTDAVSENERREMLGHLAECASCREGITQLCRYGILFVENEPALETKADWTTFLKKHRAWHVLASCCILFLIGLTILPSVDPAHVAYRNVQKMLHEDEKVFSMQLPENGYRLSGTSTVKTLPTMDEHKREVRSAYETLVDQYPNHIDFRTEYGKYLLFVIQDTELARLQLERALELSLQPAELKRAPELHQLLGTAKFMSNDDTAAQKHFRDALALDPENVDAKINLAVSLYRSGDRKKSLEILQELRSEKISDILRNKIDGFLDRE